MSQRDKVLDVLALSDLPEAAKIARLAHQKIGKVFSPDEAKAVIRCYFSEWHGHLPALTGRLIAEKIRQEKIHNERQAGHAADRLRCHRYTQRFLVHPKGSAASAAIIREERIRHAQVRFGPHVTENFNGETLALMDLISTDVRRYTVDWLDGGTKPLPSAVIEVMVLGAASTHVNHFLIYGIEDRVKVARTNERTVRDAWALQLPRAVVESASTLKSQGYSMRNDYENQTLIITSPAGESQAVEWTGRTVED